ncbi:MAG TPA: hypothetical protein VKR06_27225 [Ktedonosporobacter sp.]|nr:hypothetical protein [Ktedonosporobacter sp.]
MGKQTGAHDEAAERSGGEDAHDKSAEVPVNRPLWVAWWRSLE